MNKFELIRLSIGQIGLVLTYTILTMKQSKNPKNTLFE